MAIELSTITFTEQHDIVPVSGVEQIFNTGIANTLAGDDIINGESRVGTVSPALGFLPPTVASSTLARLIPTVVTTDSRAFSMTKPTIFLRVMVFTT